MEEGGYDLEAKVIVYRRPREDATVHIELHAEVDSVADLESTVDTLLSRPLPVPPTASPAPPVAPPPVPVPVPSPVAPPVEEGYLVLEGPLPAGPDTFHVNIIGGTTTQVDGYSLAIGYPPQIQALGFVEGQFVKDYLDGATPFKVFQPGTVPSPYVGIMCGFWSNSNPSGPPPVTVPPNTVLGTVTFKWTAPGAYLLDNATKKYGPRPIIAMYTRLSGPFVPPTLESLSVEVPIA